uniref:Ground-like domain-containing protein n=1 Tax=Parascaris univalens TaxID=6257 RepID=A0A915BS23_PARUN
WYSWFSLANCDVSLTAQWVGQEIQNVLLLLLLDHHLYRAQKEALLLTRLRTRTNCVQALSCDQLFYCEDAVDTVSRIYDAARTIDNKAVVTVLCAPASALKFKVQSIRYCAAGSPELMCFVSLT